MPESFKKIGFLSAGLWLIATIVSPGNASGQGHYLGGSFNTNDYFIPPSPGWVFSLYYSYSGQNFYNGSGNKSDQIVLPRNPPVTINIGQKVNTHSVIPMLLHFGKGKIAGANWGFLVLPLINNPSASIALDFYQGQNISGSQTIRMSSFGFGDLYLQPVWLTWDKKKWSTTFSYGAWAPVGKYKPNDVENVGLGYWSHNLRAATRYKPGQQWAVTTALTYEINSKQKGVDFKEAPHLTVDYGGAYIFPKGHELGLFGFGTWQTGDDKGQKAQPAKDRVYGTGLYGSYWFVPGKIGMLARTSINYGTQNRFAGFAFQIGVNYLKF